MNSARITAMTELAPNTFWTTSGEPCHCQIRCCFPPGIHPQMPPSRLSLPGPGNYQQGKNATTEQRQVNLIDNLSVIQGSHALKFGVDYRWLSPFSSPYAYNQLAILLG